jgi:hypothetical protein
MVVPWDNPLPEEWRTWAFVTAQILCLPAGRNIPEKETPLQSGGQTQNSGLEGQEFVSPSKVRVIAESY